MVPGRSWGTSWPQIWPELGAVDIKPKSVSTGSVGVPGAYRLPTDAALRDLEPERTSRVHLGAGCHRRPHGVQAAEGPCSTLSTFYQNGC